jgi:hypothetical protein
LIEAYVIGAAENASGVLPCSKLEMERNYAAHKKNKHNVPSAFRT